MSRTVLCSRLKKELQGLDKQPFPGPLGEQIFNQVSQQAWNEWTDMQIKIINEYRLDLSEKEHKNILLNQMKAFLGLDNERSEESVKKVLHVGTPI